MTILGIRVFIHCSVIPLSITLFENMKLVHFNLAL